jgi:hypothetical protein
MPSDSHALVRLEVGSGGELELVMGREIWEALEKAVKEEGATAAVAAGRDPWMRIKLAPTATAAFNVAAVPNADNPPCPPINLKTFNVTQVAGSDNVPCPPVTG